MKNVGVLSNDHKWLISLVLVISLAFSGCTRNGSILDALADKETKSTSNEINTNRHLQISLTVDESIPTVVFSSNDLSGNFTEGLQYTQVTNVNIEVDGNYKKLEDAIKNGSITAEEIFYYARLDARNEICEEIYESKLGLTHFTYQYPEYTLRLIYDIYETPDGEQHLISDMGLYKPGVIPEPYNYFYGGDGLILRYDLEDWGLDFEIKETSSTGATIAVYQSGGQQIGELMLAAYFLGKDEVTPVDRIDGLRESVYVNYGLASNGITEISLDWQETFGALSSGDYLLILSFADIYDEADIHPLVRNYYDDMDYTVKIHIP